MIKFYWLGTTSDYYDLNNWRLIDTDEIPSRIPTHQDSITFNKLAEGDLVLDSMYSPVVNSIIITEDFQFEISTVNDSTIKVLGRIVNNNPDRVKVELELITTEWLLNAMYIYYLLQDGSILKGDRIMAKNENNIQWLYDRVIVTENIDNKGRPNGYTPLDANGKVPAIFLNITAVEDAEHNVLRGRDAPDTHPIDSITGLGDVIQDIYLEVSGVLNDLSKYQLLEQKNMINGYAGLDAIGKIPIQLIPDIALKGTTDHRLLDHRDTADQHPITAITGLNASLNSKIASSEKGAPNGVTPLDGTRKIPVEYIPAVVFNNLIVSSQDTLQNFIANDSQVNSVDNGTIVELTGADPFEQWLCVGHEPLLASSYTKISGVAITWDSIQNKPNLVIADSDNKISISIIRDIDIILDGKQSISEKDQPDGYAGLDSDGKLNPDLLPTGIFPIKNVLEVSDIDGDDITGDGSAQTPFKTINRAIQAGPANMANTPIKVNPGSYSNVVISKPGISLIGVDNVSCIINNVTISLSGDTDTVFYGLNIKSLVTEVTTTTASRVCKALFRACIIVIGQNSYPVANNMTFQYTFKNSVVTATYSNFSVASNLNGVTVYESCVFPNRIDSFYYYTTKSVTFKHCDFFELYFMSTGVTAQYIGCKFSDGIWYTSQGSRFIDCRFESVNVVFQGTRVDLVGCDFQRMDGTFSQLNINMTEYTLSHCHYSLDKSQLVGIRLDPDIQDADITSSVQFANITPATNRLRDILADIDLRFAGFEDPLTTDEVFTAREFPLIGTEYGMYNPSNPVPQDITLTEMFENMFTKVVPPVYKYPTATLTSNNTVYTAEVGTTGTINLSILFTQNDGGAITNATLTKDGINFYSSSVLPSGVASNLTYGITANVYGGTVSYAQGPIKNDNTGTPYPDGRIPAGTVNTNTLTYIGKRMAFAGGMTGTQVPTTSTQIRALDTKVLGLQAGNSLTFTLPAGRQIAVLAYDATLPAVTSIIYDVMTADYTDLFVASALSINGANGFTAIPYRLYCFILDIPASADMRFIAKIGN